MMFQEVKTKKRGLREILPPRHEAARPSNPPPIILPHERGRRSRGWFWPLLLVLIVLAVATYAVTKIFARVTVVGTPLSYRLPIDQALTAAREGGNLNFELVKLEPKTGERAVTASGTERVSRSAGGVVVIYNNFDRNPLKLVANTRLESKAGKIYRIRQPVVVPGSKIVAGKSEPGAVEATVYADEPGASHNSDPTDFSLPGLKGDPRFDKVFGRSKTAIVGGMIGEVRKLSPEDEKSARAALRAELTKELLSAAKAKIPDTFVLFPDLALIEVKDLSDLSVAAGKEVAIRESLTFEGVILPREALTAALIDARVPGQASNELQIADFNALKAVFVPLPTGSLAETKTLNLQFNGVIESHPKIDPDVLRAQLASKNKTEALKILSQVKGLEKYRLIYRPPWLSQMPSDPSRILFKFESQAS